MSRSLAILLSLALAVPVTTCAPRSPAGSATAPAAPSLTTTEFAGLIEKLSEPGGFFPSDNLVSNETSYLHVLGRMHQIGVRGGAYIGVGPDQNFSYIAAVRPEIAFLIDIRRDNLLQHLLFKASFENARNRIAYLCFMTGRTPPRDLAPWDTADIARILEYVDTVPADPRVFEETSLRALESVQRYGYPLAVEDLAQIIRIHRSFFVAGLDVRYSNRGWMSSYPNWRMLILGTDLDDRRRNYLATEESFRYVKDMERRNMMVPVTGDLSGPQALAGIGREISERGLHVSAFYTSNVEQYLFQGGGFVHFAETVSALPFDSTSVIIRSFFRGRHPLNVPGHSSTQLLERITDFTREFTAGGYRSYLDVVMKNVVPLRK